MGMDSGAATLEDNLTVPKTIKPKVTKWTSTSTFSMFSPNLKTGTKTNSCTQMFIVPVLIIAKRCKKPNVHQLRNVLWCGRVQPTLDCLSPGKKKGELNMDTCYKWLNLETIMLSKRR